eukprot:9719257-Prorocentrum_lima.AAC.1
MKRFRGGRLCAGAPRRRFWNELCTSSILHNHSDCDLLSISAIGLRLMLMGSMAWGTSPSLLSSSAVWNKRSGCDSKAFGKALQANP